MERFEPLVREAELPLRDQKEASPSKKGFKGSLEPVGVEGEADPSGKETSEKDLLPSVREYLIKGRTQVHHKRRKERSSILVIFLIDSSGSMAKDRQIAHIKGVIGRTLEAYKDRRVRFAAVSLLDGAAELLSPPVVHPDGLLEAIQALRTGGRTDLLEGFRKLSSLMREQERYSGRKGKEGLRLFILTDGRVNAGDPDDPFGAAVRFYKEAIDLGHRTTVVDTEQGPVRLDQAERLAEAIGAERSELSALEE